MNTTAPTPYTPLRPARSCTLPVRGLDYHLLRWGEPRVDQPLLVLAHGWMDVAASYQFLVDALPPDYAIVAPDWRGFGATVVPQQIDHFLFADYLLDLDYLLDQLTWRLNGLLRDRHEAELIAAKAFRHNMWATTPPAQVTIRSSMQNTCRAGSRSGNVSQKPPRFSQWSVKRRPFRMPARASA